ncbi:MAG: hypothetical protein QM811_06500 [Pirellulales bacterium]
MADAIGFCSSCATWTAQRQIQRLQSRHAVDRDGRVVAFGFENREVGPDRDQLAGGGARLTFEEITELHLGLDVRFQTGAFGGDRLGRVAAVEIHDLAGTGADDVDRFLFAQRVNRQRAERGRRDLFGQAPPVAQFDVSFAHEESETVLEDRDRLGGGGFQTVGFSSASAAGLSAARTEVG